MTYFAWSSSIMFDAMIVRKGLVNFLTTTAARAGSVILSVVDSTGK